MRRLLDGNKIEPFSPHRTDAFVPHRGGHADVARNAAPGKIWYTNITHGDCNEIATQTNIKAEEIKNK